MLKIRLLIQLFLNYLIPNTLQLQRINVGGLFYEDEFALENVFKEAIVQFNNEYKYDYKLMPLTKQLSTFADSNDLKNEVCDLIENDVYIVFGPSAKAGTGDVIEVICNSTGVPHVLFDGFHDEDDLFSYNLQMTLNIYPSQLMLSRSYADIINNFGWKKFTIVYQMENVNNIYKIQDLLELYSIHSDLIRVRKFERGDDYRVLWKDIQDERRIILDCSPDIVKDVLRAGMSFNLLGPLNHIFLTNLDIAQIDFGDFQNDSRIEANITAARLLINYGLSTNLDTGNSYQHDSSRTLISLKSYLLQDAFKLFLMALNNMSDGQHYPNSLARCSIDEHGNSWHSPRGRNLMRTMKNLANSGHYTFHSGSIRFNDRGQRSEFHIEIYDALSNYNLAVWNTGGEIISQDVKGNITKRKMVYRVATRIGEPYFMEDPDAIARNVSGNNRYIGYAVDLIAAIAKEVDFEYKFVPVQDNAYGKYNKKTKQWNGIIGELINNDAHMGICDLTITQARKSVVDFTVPFMQLGISILAYQKPHELKTWNAFLDPFTLDVWIYVMISIFCIAFLFIVMARISQSEWENPHPCSRDPDILENKWNISNSFWLTMGSIMTAGSDILPRSAPMRIFSAMWWIFAVIISNSYTANLAAFLTNIKMEGSIASIKDLAEQSKIKFGTMEGGSTYTFFSETNETVYRLAYNMMQNDDPSAYTKDNKEGVERVLKNNGSYMFLMETTSIEYNTERNCRLKMLGEKFGEKHYAIAVPFGAEYRSRLSVAILKLSERGELFQLKNKWWKNHKNVCHRDTQIEASEAPDMTFSEVRGIFYTLGVGVFIAYIVGIIEFLYFTHKKAVEEKMLFKQVLLEELKFVLRFWENKKTIK